MKKNYLRLSLAAASLLAMGCSTTDGDGAYDGYYDTNYTAYSVDGMTGEMPEEQGDIWYATTFTKQPLLVQAIFAAAFFLLGLIFCGKAESDLCKHDPGSVIIDETAAAFLTFLGVNFSIWTALTGLFLNRFFDILKPWPINKLQKLPGAWGIMLDDTLAGVFSRIILGLLLYFFPVLAR